ncbi:MAG: hypothetical protein M3322_08130 [Actinomycetota bacterium]|nr:hypothetical protein [Actinomycetota bacterium]
MGGRADMVRRFLLAAAALWTLRWAALELAALASHLLPERPSPHDPARPPGWMPGPFD